MEPVAKFRDTNPIAKAMTIKNNVRTEICFWRLDSVIKQNRFQGWEELTNVCIDRVREVDFAQVASAGSSTSVQCIVQVSRQGGSLS